MGYTSQKKKKRERKKRKATGCIELFYAIINGNIQQAQTLSIRHTGGWLQGKKLYDLWKQRQRQQHNSA